MLGTVRTWAAGAALAALALPSAHAAAPTVVVTWNQAVLAELRAGALAPPVAARALAITHTCIYDAWTAYDAAAFGVVSSLPRRPSVERTTANKSAALSHAAYNCLLNLFPAGATRLQAVMTGLGHNPWDTTRDLTRPQGIGNSAAAAVIASRRSDGSNQYGDLAVGAYADYTGYVPANAPMPFCLPTTAGACLLNVSDASRWQPLVNDRGAIQRFAAPHWDRVTPFALTSASQFDAQGPVAAGPNYLKGWANLQADIDSMLAYSAGITMQRKVIVEYWADGPESELPPGHWGLFAQFVSQRDANTIDQDVKMFFALHNASFDAGIAAWHLKRKYDGVRPITSVRYFRQGQQVLAWGGPQQPVKWIDAGKWTPYNPGSNLTPSFPGWVSGHSTFSAASAAVLRAFTGSDTFGYSTVVPPGFGRVEPNVPAVPTTLSYPTFTAAAQDAGLSRLYAGIHYADDNTVGLWLGDQVGQQAWDRARALGTLASGMVAEWMFDDTIGTQVPDRSGSGRTLTLNAGASIVQPSISGAAVRFAGAAQPFGATATATINTANSFSVAGWIRFNQLPNCQNQALASQDGITVYGFLLGIDAPCNGSAGAFKFAMRAFDADIANRYSATTGHGPATGTWVHLAGVRDAATGMLTLYVNGRAESTVAYPYRWSANGSFAVGRGKFSGQLRDPVYGDVDGVRVHSRALSAAEVQALYKAAR
ncbi:DUF6851 domain-containing protein [Ideonella sp. A 288]|uniref:DUF6851 domain-containing protein n=1 Tax=Ideonella sp. A 288 TaxID=1962181 RepID=UPI001303C19F|nr:LamG-like jellyroll fold domain-containing protein [Ideonella sp. A 288]